MFVLLQGLSGTGTVCVNDIEVGRFLSGKGEIQIEITAVLKAANRLCVDAENQEATPGLSGPVAIVIEA